MNIEQINKINSELDGKSPAEVVAWAIGIAKKPIITTNFRPYEAAILHVVTQIKPDIDVVWCDTGYNTRNTYQHADRLIKALGLNIDLYVPKQTAAYRDTLLGIPDIDSPEHQLFSEQVKLEPFQRAMQTHRPDVWFTNLRKGQTALRDTLDIVSLAADGVIKVSPFYHYSDKALDNYLSEHGLENEFKYYDPTKVLNHRECGIHVANNH